MKNGLLLACYPPFTGIASRVTLIACPDHCQVAFSGHLFPDLLEDINDEEYYLTLLHRVEIAPVLPPGLSLLSETDI